MDKSKVDPAALITATMAGVLAVVLSEGPYTAFEMAIGATLMVAMFGYGRPTAESRDDVIIFSCACGFAVFIFISYWLEQAYVLIQALAFRPIVGIPATHAAGWWLLSSALVFIGLRRQKHGAKQSDETAGGDDANDASPHASPSLQNTTPPASNTANVAERNREFLDNWSFADERQFLENLLYQRVNCFLVLLGLVIAGALSARSQAMLQIALWFGTVLLGLLAIAIGALQRKLEYVFEVIFHNKEHPITVVSARWNHGHVRGLIGYGLPAIGVGAVAIGALLASTNHLRVPAP